jgi:zinc transport system ATP-binding protein
MMGKFAVDMRDVYFFYERQKVLDGIDLTVEQGEFLALIGPNGSGKSTLVKCLLGLERPERGEIRLFGEPVGRLKQRYRIGYVSQKANSFNAQFPATVREVVASGLYGKLGLFRRMGKKEWGQVEEVLEQVGLAV